MAFILTFTPPAPATPGPAASATSAVRLLQLCSEGRGLFEYAAPGVHLAVDRVDHDCVLIRQERLGELKALAVCFGWCGRLGRSGARFDAETFAALLSALRADPRHPGRAALHLTGNFVVVVMDLEFSRAFVINDEWAVRCFYYGSCQDRVVVSSRAAAVASLVAAPLDGMSWVAGLRGSFPAAHGTMFQGVRRALPGQAICADLAGGSVRLASEDLFTDRHVRRSFADSQQVLADAVRRSVRRGATLVPGFVDLTGGNDTRMTAAALSAEHLAGATVFQVCVSAGSADGALAQQIASRLGARLLIRDREAEPDVSAEYFRGCSLLFDGYTLGLGNARRMWAARHAYGDYHYHWGSLGGELSRDYFWRHEYLRLSRQVDLDYLLKRRLYAPWRDRILGAAGIALAPAVHDAYLLAPLHAIVQNMPGISRFYILDLLYLGRLAQKSALGWAYAPQQTVVLPFLAKEYLDAALGAGWWQRANRRLSLAVVSHLEPRLSDLPNDHGMTMRPLAWATLGQHARTTLGELWRRKLFYRRSVNHLRNRPPRIVPHELLARSRELDSAGIYPEEASRLLRWVGTEGTAEERLDLIPALVGLGEILQAYPEIRRSLSFDNPACPFLADQELRPAREKI